MFAETYSILINDLRFALEVMEDRSHLGLNPERAATLRTLMEHRISEAEQAPWSLSQDDHRRIHAQEA